ncbi:transposase family protein [Streptomyces sp. NPDC001020]
MFAYAAAENVTLRIDGTETQVRRPQAHCPGRRAFVTGKRRQNTIKTTTISDHQGRTLWSGATRPGRMHDQTAVRTEGIAEQFRQYPAVKAEVDEGYRGLANEFRRQPRPKPCTGSRRRAASLRGRLEFDGPAPGTPLKVKATRTDATGTHGVGTATVREDGTFTVLDEPDLAGDATYTVSFLGDLTHRPAEDLTRTVAVGKAPTSIALTAPAEATLSGGVTIAGTFTAQGKALGDRAVLKVVRTDQLGTGTLSSVTVAADGTFTINDIPRARREVTYTVSWPGDGLHTASSASATVFVKR